MPSETAPSAKRTLSVILGFGGLLLLMAILIADSSLQRRNIAASSGVLRKDYQQRDALLDEFRTNTLRSGSLMRDYLLETNSDAASEQRAELQTERARNGAILSEYRILVQPNEIASMRDLTQGNSEYWQLLLPALNWTADERARQGKAFLHDSLAPHRKDLMQLIDDVNRMNQRDAAAEETRIQEIETQSQKRVTAISSLAFVLAIALASAVIFHVGNLERESARRLVDLEQARYDLRRLSDRLVNAQEQERRNLSRELHDDLGQTMSAMLMELGRLESKVRREASPSQNEPIREMFSSVRRLAEAGVGKIRDLALGLRPAMLDQIGLIPALRWHAREVTRRSGMKVDVVAEGAEDDDLPDSYRTCIYRVVQEALHNCVKHAQASYACVTLARSPAGGFSVSIEDNGVGLNPARDKGLGLLGIAERVNQLHGQFRIESEPPKKGTIASISLPAPSPAQRSVEESVV